MKESTFIITLIGILLPMCVVLGIILGQNIDILDNQKEVISQLSGINERLDNVMF